MVDGFSEEERRLRRNLLFRLLRGFDFDAPRYRYEPLAAPVEGWQLGARDAEAGITSAA